MIDNFNFFTFPVNGTEVEEYVLSFYEKYGETSEIFKVAEEEFNRYSSSKGLWVNILNNIRQNMSNMGFEKEVKLQDEIFKKEWTEKFSQICKYNNKTILEMRTSYLAVEGK